MRRRAFTPVEILVVVAILAVLAALLLPAFARAKGRAKLTDCGARLHAFAAALNLYRADHDNRGYAWWRRDDGTNGFRAPYDMFEGMRAYLGDGSPLWCPEPNSEPTGFGLWNLYAYQAYPVRRDDRPGGELVVPWRPAPGTVVAACENHAGSEFDPRGFGLLRMGSYPFVREDASLGIVRNEAIRGGLLRRARSVREAPIRSGLRPPLPRRALAALAGTLVGLARARSRVQREVVGEEGVEVAAREEQAAYPGALARLDVGRPIPDDEGSGAQERQGGERLLEHPGARLAAGAALVGRVGAPGDRGEGRVQGEQARGEGGMEAVEGSRR